MIIVTLPANTWTNLYSVSGIAAAKLISLQVQSPSARLILKAQLAQPAASDDTGAEAFENDWYTFNAGTEGAWVKPLTGESTVAIFSEYDSLNPSRYGGRSILYGRTIDRLATQALNYRDDAVSRGLGYYAYVNQTIANGAKAYARFVCPSDRYVVLLGREIITDNTKLFYRTYTAFTGGTVGASIPVHELRPDTIYPTGSAINFMTAPTPTAGADVTNFPLYGSSGTGNRVSGGSDASDTFRLLPPGSIFLIEWENASTTGAINVFTQYTWFELPSNVIL